MSVPEIIPLAKPQKYVIKSVKIAIWLKEGADNGELVAHIDDISKKNVCYHENGLGKTGLAPSIFPTIGELWKIKIKI